jgi:hypothetical protein
MSLKRPTTPFYAFVKDKMAEMGIEMGVKVSIKESALMFQAWDDLSESQKKPYNDIADIERARYEKICEIAYNAFISFSRAAITNDNPGLAEDKLEKKFKKAWKELNNDEKKPFYDIGIKIFSKI